MENKSTNRDYPYDEARVCVSFPNGDMDGKLSVQEDRKGEITVHVRFIAVPKSFESLAGILNPGKDVEIESRDRILTREECESIKESEEFPGEYLLTLDH